MVRAAHTAGYVGTKKKGGLRPSLNIEGDMDYADIIESEVITCDDCLIQQGCEDGHEPVLYCSEKVNHV
jgi:hypothetical protein